MKKEKNGSKKVVSIARKIKYMWVVKLLSIFVAMDIIMALVLSYSFILYAPDVFWGVVNRTIDLSQNPQLTGLLRIAAIFGIGIAIVQTIIVVGNLISSSRNISHTLQPLNDIANLTNQLGNVDSSNFNEVKVHNLEDAISRVSVDGPNGTLKTRDSDLKGLEDAINNLIERIRESYRQQSRFVSDASHELRTPIAVIQGYANMLDRWGKEDETVLEESIEAIKNESEHMKKLVEQLLFLARGDSGKNKLNMQSFSLYNMIKEVYEESLMIDENHIYELKGDESAMAYGDLDMLKQTARILVDNAAKYTLEKDVITLCCGINVEGNSYFYIQDNGIGMEENDVKHVFERFYRADTARDKKTGGTGLGLSIAKLIVDKHSGYFEVLSRKDIGTRISVVLPVNSGQ